MRDTIVGDGWRWVIVILGFTASLIMALLLRAAALRVRARRLRGEEPDPHDRGEIPALIGGSLVCFFIATGTLGVIFGWDSVFRLPFMATALAYTVAGRGLQLLHQWKAE